MDGLTLKDMTTCFSENAKTLRKKSGLTQKQLAEQLGIKRILVGAIEEGRTCSLKVVYKYSRYFNHTIDELVTTIIKL